MIINSVISKRDLSRISIIPSGETNLIIDSGTVSLGFTYRDYHDAAEGSIIKYLNGEILDGTVLKPDVLNEFDVTSDINDAKGLYQFRFVVSNYFTDTNKIDYNILYGYTELKDMVFEYETTDNYKLLSYSGSSSSITIPDYYISEEGTKPVTIIGQEAFKDCLSEIIILSENLVTIEYGAFFNSALTSITIPASVTTIGASAFFSCDSLTELTMQSLVPPTLDGANSFDYDKLITILVPNESLSIYQNTPYWSEYSEKMLGY